MPFISSVSPSGSSFLNGWSGRACGHAAQTFARSFASFSNDSDGKVTFLKPVTIARKFVHADMRTKIEVFYLKMMKIGIKRENRKENV